MFTYMSSLRDVRLLFQLLRVTEKEKQWALHSNKAQWTMPCPFQAVDKWTTNTIYNNTANGIRKLYILNQVRQALVPPYTEFGNNLYGIWKTYTESV